MNLRLKKKPNIPSDWEPALTVGKTTFYRFKDIQHLTTAGRWFFINDYIQQVVRFNMGRDGVNQLLSTLKSVAEQVKADLNPKQTESGAIEWRLDTALTRLDIIDRIISQAEDQLKLFPELESIYQIAVRVLFLPGDNLAEDIHPNEAARRIELLKKKEVAGLVSMKPISNMISIAELYRDISLNVLETHQAMRKAHINFWMNQASSTNGN